jgi:predicted RNase H-like HicB family nuclease
MKEWEGLTRVYPVVLTPTPNGYVVTVPDLDINTQGKDIAEAIYMARDAIGLWGICEEDDGRTIPEPSTSEPAHDKEELLSWIDIDFGKYRLMNDMSTVRMNITLPKFLKALGDEAGVNFSHELQERLKERLVYTAAQPSK